MRLIVLIDGEHYPPVVREAIAGMRAQGDDVVAAVFLGGTEKIAVPATGGTGGMGDLGAVYGLPVAVGDDREHVLVRAIAEWRPDAVVDLSDDPIVTPTERLVLAARTLAAGVCYRGADFTFDPPRLDRVLTKPSIRVIATGKRTGKTAVAGALARHAVHRGRRPVVVAMGRGGPDPPEVVEVGRDLSPTALLALADAGGHAASDYIEDAVTSRVTTIGCRRVGGGLAGAAFSSNVLAGAELAESRAEDLVILEGSGAAIPPVATEAGLLCVAAGTDPARIRDHLGLYRLLLADTAVVTMSDNARTAAPLAVAIRELAPQVDIVETAFRPEPLGDVSGRRVFVCSTAPPEVSDTLSKHLEEVHGCEVVGVSHQLADRRRLEREIHASSRFDVLLTELKAGAVEVVVRLAVDRGLEIVFMDNGLVGEGVEEAFDRLLERAEPSGPRQA